MKKDLKFGLLMAFLVILAVVLGAILSQNNASACELEDNFGVAWFAENYYYMPGEVVEIDQNGAKFRGSNGVIYEASSEYFGDISSDFVYLLTMFSNGTEEWEDDKIAVIWRT